MENAINTVTKNYKPTHGDRIYYLDWLRVMAILLVFFIHCAKIFDYHTQVVFNTVRSPVLSAFRDFTLIWVMPLFFVLSGAAVFLSKGPDNAKEFIKTRFLRLFIPLLLVGMFIINPLYVYIERLSSNQTVLGFFQWYPEYFNGLYGFGGNFVPLGQGTHLWYLEFLFIYSLILIPLFVRSGGRDTSFLSRISNRFETPGALFLLFLPISLVAAGFEIIGLGGVRTMGGWDPISYLFFFIYGYLIFSNPKIGETIKSYGLIFLAVAVILTAILVDLHFGFTLRIPGLHRHDILNNGALLPLNHVFWVAVQAIRGVLAWCWVIGILGVGYRFLNFNSRFLKYANEAVLPFYILHHSIIYVAGFLIVQTDNSIGTKFTGISLVSFAVIMTIYEMFVRRFNVPRFLFGMKGVTKIERHSTVMSAEQLRELPFKKKLT